MKLVGRKMVTRRARRGFSGFTPIETAVSQPTAAIGVAPIEKAENMARTPMIKDKRTKRSRVRAAAFVLADAIVAVFVLGTIGGAFCLALSSGFFVLQNTREDLRATQILMQRIEAIRLCTWSELSQITFQENYDPFSGTNQSSGAKYYGNVTIGPAVSVPGSASYAPNMCLVTVNVNWTNYNHSIPVPHSRQMQTQVARYGLQNYIWGAIP
jgi:hypothetical protein